MIADRYPVVETVPIRDAVNRAYGLGPGVGDGAPRCLAGRGTGRAQAARAGGMDGMDGLGGLGGDGEPGGAEVLEGGDVVDVAQGEADVVEAFHQAPAGVAVDLERCLDPGRLG
jgi:hypothetical protein